MSNEAALWYVIHTYSGYENKVAENIQRMVETRGLEDLIFETMIPTEIVVDSEESAENYVNSSDPYNGENADGNKKVKENKAVERKIFPSYVLIKMVMNDATWHIIRNIRGVTGFVGPGSRPVPLTEKEVAALGVEVRVRERAYKVGDSVMVVAGFIAGSIATVEEINDQTGRIKITANIGGRETAVELDANEVEPLKS